MTKRDMPNPGTTNAAQPAMTAADFDRFAPFYDLEFGEYADDLPLYRAFAARAVGPVLELGCGTGRALIPLAEDGWMVTGVDLSPALLALARDAAARAGVAARVTLVQDDIRTLAALGRRRFALAFSAINSFFHLETQADQLAALSAVARRLRPDGVFIADLFPPHPDLLLEYDGRVVHAGAFRDPRTGERIDKFSTSTLDAAEQRIETTFFYDRVRADGAVQRTATPFVLRYTGRFELQLLLERAGFTGVTFYGSYDLEPFTAASERMIAIATRAS
ncbi:MAG: class I SAM-dependent methyltransferase [Thermomicrobiales bacterium]